MAFGLRIAGYQFPGDATAGHDFNWLIVEGAAHHPWGDWRFRDPSPLTSEVARPAGWLGAVAAGTEPGRCAQSCRTGQVGVNDPRQPPRPAPIFRDALV
jgi:hypothetical protein